MIPSEQTAEEFKVEYWRNEFNRLLSEVGSPRRLAKELATKNDYFSTAKGVSDVNNAKKNRAGLEATRRIVLAMLQLQQATQATVDRETRFMRRQRLTRI